MRALKRILPVFTLLILNFPLTFAETITFPFEQSGGNFWHNLWVGPTEGAVIDREQLAEGSKLCFIGDSGTGEADQYLVAQALEQEQCKQIFILGDIIYPNGLKSKNDVQFRTKFFDPYSNLLQRGIPFYMVLGNHDYRQNPDAWIDIFQEYSQIVMPSRYYALMQGDVCFYMFDTNTNLYPQQLWQDEVKKRYKQQCKLMVTMGHHPLISSGEHGNAPFNRASYFKRFMYGARVYLAGHDHQLSDEGVRFETRLLVSGAAAKLRSLSHKPAVWGKSAFGYVVLTLQRQPELAFNYRFVTVDQDSVVRIEHQGIIKQ